MNTPTRSSGRSPSDRSRACTARETSASSPYGIDRPAESSTATRSGSARAARSTHSTTFTADGMGIGGRSVLELRDHEIRYRVDGLEILGVGQLLGLDLDGEA